MSLHLSFPPAGLCVLPRTQQCGAAAGSRPSRDHAWWAARALAPRRTAPAAAGTDRNAPKSEPPPQAVSADVRPKAAFLTPGRGNFAGKALQQQHRATGARAVLRVMEAANKEPRGELRTARSEPRFGRSSAVGGTRAPAPRHAAFSCAP